MNCKASETAPFCNHDQMPLLSLQPCIVNEGYKTTFKPHQASLYILFSSFSHFTLFPPWQCIQTLPRASILTTQATKHKKPLHLGFRKDLPTKMACMPTEDCKVEPQWGKSWLSQGRCSKQPWKGLSPINTPLHQKQQQAGPNKF